VEEIVTATSHCSPVSVGPDLQLRLGSHTAFADSVRFFVVQACHSSGTLCSPLLTYRSAMPPVYTVAGKVLKVRLLGGNEPEVHAARFDAGDTEYAVRVERITGDVGQAGVDAFQRQVRHRCPPGNRQYPAG
jgi:hypothetical protein